MRWYQSVLTKNWEKPFNVESTNLIVQSKPQSKPHKHHNRKKKNNKFKRSKGMERVRMCTARSSKK